VDYIRIASLVEVPEGELRAYESPTGRVAVAHIENRVFGVGDECPAGGCSLAEEGVLSGSDDAVECSRDGSVFDLASGEPLAGPAIDPIPVFPLRVDNGWIEVAASPVGDS
jgi:3-phenylpropionate/trans-cinnamate dioxygenase ferredoxin subunit